MKYLAFKNYFYKIIVKKIMFVTWFQINYRKMSFNCPWKMYINTASKDLIELNCQLINHWTKLGVTSAHCAFFFN